MFDPYDKTHSSLVDGLSTIYIQNLLLENPNLSPKIIVCMLSHEPLAGLLLNSHVYITRQDQFGNLDLKF